MHNDSETKFILKDLFYISNDIVSSIWQVTFLHFETLSKNDFSIKINIKFDF